MWVGGELVHVEDLVLHDARMDVRAPTHELTIAHRILRARRRIAGAKATWAVSDAGIGALTGYEGPDEDAGAGEGLSLIEEPGDLRLMDESDPLARELANVDALLEQSQRLLDKVAGAKHVGRQELVVGDLVVRDPDWDEEDRLTQWKHVLRDASDLPPTLGAALIWDAWESLEPMQRQHWLGSQLVSACLRARGKVASHLFGFNVGLKTIPRERRRSTNRLTRLLAFLDAMSASAESGMKEIARLAQAREQMARRLNGRRSSSSLPTVIELVLSRPIVSAPMIAKTAKVTQRGALIVFAVMHLLGLSFEPRIPRLSDRKLYAFEPKARYGTLAPLFGHRLDAGLIRTHWEDVQRIIQALRNRLVTPSLILKKLSAYRQQNSLAAALREIGRIERTLFTLRWFEDPELRRLVTAELNKGEAKNSLSRAVAFHRLGRFRDRGHENQASRAAALNLVTAAIILFNCRYLGRVVDAMRRRGTAFDERIIPQLSPLGWDHINITGDYVWSDHLTVDGEGFLPLRIGAS